MRLDVQLCRRQTAVDDMCGEAKGNPGFHSASVAERILSSGLRSLGKVVSAVEKHGVLPRMLLDVVAGLLANMLVVVRCSI